MGIHGQMGEVENLLAIPGKVFPAHCAIRLLIQFKGTGKLFTEDMLAKYDGSDPKLPIYLAVYWCFVTMYPPQT